MKDSTLCPNCNSAENTKVSPPTAQDFVDEWGSDLEGANRHSLTDMPETIYGILEKEIKDQRILLRIIRRMYDMGIGVE